MSDDSTRRVRRTSSALLAKPCRKCGTVNRYPSGKCRTCASRRSADAKDANRVCRKCGATDRMSGGACRPCARRSEALRGPRKASPELMAKPCIKCGAIDRTKWSGQCRPCRKARIKVRLATPEGKAKSAGTLSKYKSKPETKAKIAAAARRRRYGLSPEEQDAMLLAQKGRCAACGDLLKPGNGTHLDHDHQTHKARGFVCPHCNTAIGHLKDSPLRARKLASYLERHQPTPNL